MKHARPAGCDPIPSRLRRIGALVRKESRQMLRDPSTVLIGIVMPALLIFIFGYGLSLDVKNVPIAVVLEHRSPEADELAAGFSLSPYFKATVLTAMPLAQELMNQRQVDGIVRIRQDFSRQLASNNAEVQVVVHGSDANYARIVQGYAEGAINQSFQRKKIERADINDGPVIVQNQTWFNKNNDSHYFLVPGLIVLIMTLIGALLTALLMAREWEQGTLEAIFVTPVRVGEILLGKIIPYFCLGVIGLALCLLAAKFLFNVPMRGSTAVLAGASMLYLLVALGMGLLISAATKNQFLASQIAIIVSYLPAMMLSGFLFDIRSMPVALRVITHVLPARYYNELLQTVFLAGDIWPIIIPNLVIIAGMAVALLWLARVKTKKKLG